MNEKWTYLILSDADRNPTGVRVILQDRDTDGRKVAMQLLPSGEQTDLDTEAHDYEAMEWKVLEIFNMTRGGGAEPLLAAVKDHLRAGYEGG